MITIQKKKYEKVVSELIYSRDIRQLVTMYSLDKIFYFSILKDISRGRKSPNYRILRRIARQRNLDENFIVQQARSVLEFYTPYYRRESPEYYAVLNVGADATEKEIRRSWIELMKSHHPDKAGREGADRAKKINEAYQVLKDTRKRDEYDRKHLPYIPVYVSDRRILENLYYAVPVMLVAIVVLAYVAGSGLVFDSREAKEKSAGVLEDSVRPESSARSVPAGGGEASGTGREEPGAAAGAKEKPVEPEEARAPDEREEPGVGAASEPGTASEKPQSEESPPAGDEPESRALARRDRAEGGDVSHRAAPVGKEPERGDRKPLEETPDSRSTPAEVAALLSEGDGADQKGERAEKEEVQRIEVKREKTAPGQTASAEGEEASQTGASEGDIGEKSGAGPGEKALAARNKDAGQDPVVKTESERKSFGDKDTAAAEADPERLKTAAGVRTYTVREGDSLWSIARRFDTGAAEIIRLNSLAGDKLDVGDELIVSAARAPASARPDSPAQDVKGAPEKREAAVKKTVPRKAQVPEGGTVYTVREGDSLWTIARRFGTTVGELIGLNGLPDNELDVGDKLVVRGSAAGKAAGDKKDSKDGGIEPPLVSEKKDSSQPAGGIKQQADRMLVPEAKAVEKTAVKPAPDRDSLYVFVSEYVSAYKNGDISRLESLFLPDAVENGVGIKNVLSSYRSNFETLEIIAYDINIQNATIINDAGAVEGGFFIKFRDRRTGLTKDSRGRIDWRLVWSGGVWRVAELSYKIQKTDVTAR